ncbi:MAG: acetylxylan esterase, partial [Planctomycetaceae bacterium]|nr:acetylxylan esterase [Planctomycetaceae bacterium]
MRSCLLLALLCFLPALSAAAAEPARAKDRADARLGTPRNLRDAYHPWSPPATAAAWSTEKEAIRRRILVSQGLWPMPPRPEIEASTHGKIDRDGYTIEQVYFASHPGHYVTGNLYRPKGRTGKLPGVLCPHGHWANGRFYEADDAKQKEQLDKEAEQTEAGARYPVQARMVQLARMGYVVFHYDMVGYADSRQIAHRAGFTDAAAGLWLQNFMGLQTFNSIRALDFLVSLPDVDPERIGVTGSSGGGTQTFMLCAVDPRPAVAFPAVMVSTGMQGGCVCENASYLRIGLNNVALAAVFAPKPMAMSGADDWTVAIETRGLPELKQVYGFSNQASLVEAKAYPQFKHNYNQVAREMMYAWFHEHLSPDMEQPLTEEPFKPVPPAELSVFDDSHKLPTDAVDATGLRKYLTEVSQRQFAAALPKSKDDVAGYAELVRPALQVMLDASVPARDDILANVQTKPWNGLRLTRGTISHVGEG